MPEGLYLLLDELELSADWVPFEIPMPCSSVECTGEQDWYWCTDKEGASRRVAALVNYMLISNAGGPPGRPGLSLGLRLCYVKGTGKLYRKFAR